MSLNDSLSFLLRCKMQRKIFFCRNDVEARFSVRTPSYAPAVQILTLKNDPTCISAPPVFIKYKFHWDGVGSVIVEK